MRYNDFVIFLLAEEDKQSTPALQYWFHVLDCNADGLLDAHDLRLFYEELLLRLEAMGEELVPFNEIMNELIDMVAPACMDKLTLSDIRRSGLGYVSTMRAFLLFLSLLKFTRDPSRLLSSTRRMLLSRRSPPRRRA